MFEKEIYRCVLCIFEDIYNEFIAADEHLAKTRSTEDRISWIAGILKAEMNH